ncbi:hypothetical protein [Aurantimonas sp. VKM B-3413]|uniref:hypothetical protein n=1 Tax=Aurantimonas sp. VKM B-3413 TaxID=2779401 RepID=UPI001E58E5EE|nr:hypothetical protein [Aurantimonas sp. VKM B-3413]MCB8837025.1 hypothetical protein [Aurantimonas sp. VKM B-3413]
MEDDPEIEFSPYSGLVTDHGLTVTVNIFRFADSGDGWILEVVDSANTSTVWEDEFATDEEAFAEFKRAVEAEGILEFISAPKRDMH